VLQNILTLPRHPILPKNHIQAQKWRTVLTNMQQQLSHDGIYFVLLKKKSRLAPLVIISAFRYKSGIRQENGFLSWLYGSKYSNVLLGITKDGGGFCGWWLRSSCTHTTVYHAQQKNKYGSLYTPHFVADGFAVAVRTPLSIMPNKRTSMDLCIHHILWLMASQ